MNNLIKMTKFNKWLLAAFLLLFSVSMQAQSTQLLKANKYYDLYAFNLAIDYYLDFLKTDPDNTTAITRLADCYRHTGNLERASYWYSKAVAQPDRTAESVFDYATVLKSLAKYDEAKKWFNTYSKKALGENNRTKGNHFAKSCDFAKDNFDQDPQYQIINEGVNSFTSDFGPAFYGQKLVFSSFRKDKISSAGADDINKDSYNMLYVSSFTSSGNLREANLLRDEYKAEANTCYVSYTADGGNVAFVKNNNNFTNGVLPLSGSGVKMDIYFADVETESSWNDEQPFVYNGARYSTGWPYLTPDGKTLYFASNAPKGYGGYDIYVSRKIGNNWTEPQNLGSRVNTPGNEVSPFLAGGILFFASDWHYGFGGLDIFRSESVDGVWSKVSNLGYGVNTARNDYDFIFNENKYIGFFTSNRPRGNGKDDIIQVIWPKPSYASASPTPSEENVVSTPENLVFYKGTVVNSETESLIQNVRIKATNKKTQVEIETLTDNKGRYELPLEPNTSYLVIYSAAGYLNTGRTVNVKPGASTDFLKIQELVPSPISGPSQPSRTGDFVTNTKPVNTPDVTKEADADPLPSSSVTQPSSPPAVTSKGGAEKLPSADLYEVQVGAYSKPNLDKLKDLSDLGTVYKEDRGAVQVFKVGTFGNKTDAEAARSSAVNRGFKGAFIRKVKDPNLLMAALNSSPETGKEPAPVTVKNESVPTSTGLPPGTTAKSPATKPSTPAVSSVVFKVQLGAFRNPSLDAFDERLNNWGDLQTERLDSGVTRVLLGDFSSKKAADAAREKAIEYGVQGAYIVAYKSGKKVPMDSITQ
ncbi:MAG: carboxypeptidase regulatory-like domain-containing protein [Bacteroidota bacterium]